MGRGRAERAAGRDGGAAAAASDQAADTETPDTSG
jgi:hypothetical protein